MVGKHSFQVIELVIHYFKAGYNLQKINYHSFFSQKTFKTTFPVLRLYSHYKMTVYSEVDVYKNIWLHMSVDRGT